MNFFCLCSVLLLLLLLLLLLSFRNVFRTIAASKMEFVVTSFNSFQQLTKNSKLDVAGVLDIFLNDDNNRSGNNDNTTTTNNKTRM